MTSHAKAIAVPLIIVAIGLGWLLTVQNVMPGVNWTWVLGLGVTGVGILAAVGIDKVTVVVGPFLIAATFFSLLRQTGQISIDTEMPILVIAFGTLLGLARVLPVPLPSWLIPAGQKAASGTADANAAQSDGTTWR